MDKSVYRVIDANFNRGREAVRVMEEVGRFVLNREDLSRRAKELRHRLSRAAGKLGNERLCGSRDSESDVGRGMKVRGGLERREVRDCLAAACKRFSEAMRVLAEFSAVLDKEVSGEFEAIRFDGYTLEKDLVWAFDAAGKFDSVRLYVLAGADERVSDEEVLETVRQCCMGGADCVQLRAKGISDRRFLELAKRTVEICREAGVVSIVNDRADIAAAAGADGVHLGRDDLDITSAKGLMSRPMIVGATTHNDGELEEAISAGADYVGIGPAFESATKPGLKGEGVGGLEYVRRAIRRADKAGMRYAVIGGITLDNIDELVQMGVRCAAISNAVVNASDIAGVCRRFKVILGGQQ